MGKVYLVTGGARSGKSAFAEELANKLGPDVTYIATARPHGLDMQARIVRHRERRPDTWHTRESQEDLLGVLPASTDRGAVMIECLHHWTVNRLLTLGDPRSDGWWPAVQTLETALVAEAASMCERAKTSPWNLVAVTSEVGLGPAPEMPRQRVFRDLLGRVNATIGAVADDVLFVVAGYALPLKKLGTMDPSSLL